MAQPEVPENELTRSQSLAVWKEAVPILGYIALALLALYGAASYVSQPAEEEGVVRTSDCRTVVSLPAPDARQLRVNSFGNRFTCVYIRSAKGRLLGGTCARVETDGGACKTAYLYEKPKAKCELPSTLGDNGYSLRHRGYLGSLLS